MSPKTINKTDVVSENGIKAKRGRKSKKELMASLNIEQIIKPKDIIKTTELSNKIISLSVNEVHTNKSNYEESEEQSEAIVYANILNENSDDPNIIIGENDQSIEITEEPKPVIKKRGRKPKGGKIIQQVVSNENQIEDKQNIILHLKCSMKDLQTTNSQNNVVESYNFSG
jgi:hypothetical protein